MAKHQTIQPEEPPIERLIAGDRSAWRTLVTRYSPILIAIAKQTFSNYGFTAPDQDCEDAVSETWKNTIENNYAVLRNCMNKSNLPQTLVVITKNRVVDIMRKRISEQARIDKSAVLNRYPPEEPLIPESELHECLNKLNEKERMLTDLFFLQSKSYAEISKLTNIPTNSIGPTLKRALIKLQPIVQKLLND